MLGCKLEGLAIAGRQEFRIAHAMRALDGADRMNHVLRVEVSGHSNDSLSGGQSLRVAGSPQFFARAKDFRTAGLVNGKIYAASSEQGVIRGIHDRIHMGLFGDIADDNQDAIIEE